MAQFEYLEAVSPSRLAPESDRHHWGLQIWRGIPILQLRNQVAAEEHVRTVLIELVGLPLGQPPINANPSILHKIGTKFFMLLRPFLIYKETFSEY